MITVSFHLYMQHHKIDLDSVQKTVDLADDVLASLRKSAPTANNSDNDDLIELANSIDNTSINTVNGSNETISLLDDAKPANNPFMTAKQALVRNANQKQQQQYNGSSSSSYNPAAQARKMLGAKRRFVDPKSIAGNEAQGGGYRDEGRDINTEFR